MIITTIKKSLHSVCLLHACLASDERKTGRNCSWHDFASSILTSRISALCLYGAIHLCTKHMAGFLESSELSPSPEQMEFHGNFLSEWNFLGILFGRLLARIAEYSLNGSLREVKFHTPRTIPVSAGGTMPPRDFFCGCWISGRQTRGTKKSGQHICVSPRSGSCHKTVV